MITTTLTKVGLPAEAANKAVGIIQRVKGKDSIYRHLGGDWCVPTQVATGKGSIHSVPASSSINFQ